MKQEYLAPDVILDPDTAHPNLLISKDQRSLKRIKQRQSLPDNPRRFQYRFCVLGHQRLSCNEDLSGAFILWFSAGSAKGPFFSCAKPWQVAVGVTLLALFGTLVGAVFFWRQYKKIWALSHEKESERAEKEAAQGKEQQERSAKETLELLLRWTKQQIIAGDRSQAYAGE
ncbi:PREDICTED: butyrophilin subfamily 3 member A3-like [Myotis brandtii]|uniref:butyrophilin subfamily 3 member A3-like n=1 Tax=Myotis brandtii TaxID=109478 RepID=UPI000703CA04|nr:PREDICTED: butyrophilin subfamily 3 member A3-like [Myotis brandtii]